MEIMEAGTTTKETKRGRMPDDEVDSYIMSMAANVELPPGEDAADEEEEDNDEIPLAAEALQIGRAHV